MEYLWFDFESFILYIFDKKNLEFQLLLKNV